MAQKINTVSENNCHLAQKGSMNYQQAVTAYQANPTKEVLHEQVKKLAAELTLKAC